MSASTNEDRPGRRGQARESQSSSFFTDFSRGRLKPSPSSTNESRLKGESKFDSVKRSEQEYIASLRRSIKQMKDGDAQPLREGLAELRRELEADDEVNPMDT